MKPEFSRIRRVLVFRHGAAGDLLLSTPALRALRAALPHALIEVLVARGMSGILDGNPDVDHVLEINRRSLRSQTSLYARALLGRYDCVLDMVSNPRSAILTALTRANVRVGYDLPRRGYAYTHRLPREPVGPKGPVRRYASEAGLDFVRAIGAAPLGLDLTFRVSRAAQEAMDRWLEESRLNGRPMVACLPSGSWVSKTWPAERFAASMDELADQATVLWVWGPGEEPLARRCAAMMRGKSFLAPRTDWQELAALLRRCDLLLCNDSGPKHIAVAIGTPSVTIFGPTHPATWSPPGGPHSSVWAQGLECLHCDQTVCPLPGERNMRCMRDVSTDAVVGMCRAHLRERAGRAACENR